MGIPACEREGSMHLLQQCHAACVMPVASLSLLQMLEVQTAFCQDRLRAEHRRAIDLELRPNMDHGIQNSEDHFAKETRETCQEPQPCGQCDWQSPRDFALYFFLDEWGQGAPICFGGGEVAQQRVHSTDESDPRRKFNIFLELRPPTLYRFGLAIAPSTT